MLMRYPTADCKTYVRLGSRHSLISKCTLLLFTGALFFILSAPGAFASQQVIDYFGTEAGGGPLGGQFEGARDVAVNYTGAGPADPGDVYVADGGGSVSGGRIQRFAYDDNGTPSEPYDDSYHFVSAWGADVVQPGGTGDKGNAAAGNFEICTVASQCKTTPAVPGNGTVAGDGAMFFQEGIAVDQDTGRVYVSDSVSGLSFGNNARINVYEGDGTFLYSFGFDVDATEPGTGYEVCPATHVCKAGVSGSGVGQIAEAGGIAISPPDGNPATGTVFLADPQAHRITTYGLAGESPSSIGSAAQFPIGPRTVAIDSRGIVYADRLGEIVRYDSENANGGGVGFLTPIAAPPLLPAPDVVDLDVGPDLDGGGPVEDVLYALVSSGGFAVVQQFGPVNDPGLAAPPTAEDDRHGELVGFKFVGKLGLDPAHDRLFVSANYNQKENAPLNAPPDKMGVYVLGPAGGSPSASLDSITDITGTSASVEGTINPHSGPPVSYSLEYSRDGVGWTQSEKTLLGIQSTDQPVTVELNPPGTGLEPNTLYHVRLLATKAFQAPVVSSEQTFTTAALAPQVETTGSPVRTATTAHFEGRLNPRNKATTYQFEYIDDAAYQSNLSASQPPFSGAGTTSSQPAGSGGLVELVSAGAEGLTPNTTYHYRLVADNGAAGSPAQGQEMILATRASDAPLQHGRLPGPVGSDRAYEQITMPDTGGNPVSFAMGFADNGDRALYSIAGGTPISDTGSIGSVYYAERQAGGWQTKKITPPRSELFGGVLGVGGATSDLSTVLMENFQVGTPGAAVWKLTPAGAPSRLFETAGTQEFLVQTSSLSADGSRSAAVLRGGPIDPAYPSAGANKNLYEIGAGAPRLVSLLPDESVASCGVPEAAVAYGLDRDLTRWFSVDGRYAFFPSAGQGACEATPPQLYIRDLDAGVTKLVSGPPLSGNACGADFLKATPGFAFFWTQSRLVAADAPTASCGGGSEHGGDVYRYDIAGETLECVTCVVAGLDADVIGGAQAGSASQIAVAEDGSRVYFTAGPPLLPGTPPGGTYRLELASGDLAYIGKGEVGNVLTKGEAITPDGAVMIFRSDDPGLNALGGMTNGGTNQFYRYDDRDRSLTCLSCPQDGSAPFEGIPDLQIPLSIGSAVGPNTAPLSDDGETIAFPAPSPLVNADQNTPKPGPAAGEKATDVYEWRDGRLFLITDGLTNWPGGSEPVPAGVSPTGRDIYFLAAAQYTPDALDGYKRLYDARIGGGFEFPAKPRPCPLEVCQGTPKGVPEEQEPSSGAFSGLGNAAKTARCAKPRRLVRRGGKARCVKPKQKKRKAKKNRANHDRRAFR
jgi:hypothetical protein